jgi:hypothetical protein
MLQTRNFQSFSLFLLQVITRISGMIILSMLVPLGTPKSLRAVVAQSVLRLATDWTTEGSNFESRYGQEYSLLHVVQIDFGTCLLCNVYRGLFPSRKAASE